MNYGVFSRAGEAPRVGAHWAEGDAVVDLSALDLGVPGELFEVPSLNPFMAAGREAWSTVAEALASADLEAAAVPLADVALRMPFEVADYVDFYASIHHATNVGRLFRPDNPLMPNWRHLPVGYHGRSGTIVVSGTPVRRPCGQRLDAASGEVVFGPSVRLDFELEVGFVIGTPSVMGEPVPVSEAVEHVFGVVLLNDWSARDIQAWEYQPLGPFLGKSFATSVSAWVTPLTDLEHVRVAGPVQDPEPLPYLRVDGGGGEGGWALDLRLEAERNGEVITQVSFAEMYWTLPQLVAHCTVNGASLRTGDVLASGTVSGPGEGQQGCLLEITEGRGPFLADGDEVVLRATPALAEVRATIHPA